MAPMPSERTMPRIGTDRFAVHPAKAIWPLRGMTDILQRRSLTDRFLVALIFAVDRCQENIAVRDHNQAMEAEELAQKAAEEQAQREYEEAQAKAKEWEKKTRDE